MVGLRSENAEEVKSVKRKHVVLIVLILALIGGLISLLFLFNKSVKPATPEVETFCLTQFQWEIQTFSTEQNIGEVDDKNIAIKNSKSLWLEKYSVDIPEKNIKVGYDTKEECWHVYSVPPPNVLGGVVHTIIRKNGDLLAVWIDD